MGKGYKGLKNYETWTCFHWLMRDGQSRDRIKQRFAELLEKRRIDKPDENLKRARRWAFDEIAMEEIERIEGNVPDLGATLYGDLLKRGLDNIDYIDVISAIVSWPSDRA